MCLKQYCRVETVLLFHSACAAGAGLEHAMREILGMWLQSTVGYRAVGYSTVYVQCSTRTGTGPDSSCYEAAGVIFNKQAFSLATFLIILVSDWMVIKAYLTTYFIKRSTGMNRLPSRTASHTVAAR